MDPVIFFGPIAAGLLVISMTQGKEAALGVYLLFSVLIGAASYIEKNEIPYAIAQGALWPVTIFNLINTP